MAKVAILLLTGTAGGERAKAFHALLLARGLKEAGDEVKLIFDGAGTGWIGTFADPQDRLHSLYEQVKAMGVVHGVCDFCAGHYSDKDLVQKEGLPLRGEAGGHPDLVDLIRQGYQIIPL